jgi:hypothetical protein
VVLTDELLGSLVQGDGPVEKSDFYCWVAIRWYLENPELGGEDS